MILHLNSVAWHFSGVFHSFGFLGIKLNYLLNKLYLVFAHTHICKKSSLFYIYNIVFLSYYKRTGQGYAFQYVFN